MKARASRSKLFLSHSGLDATLSAKVQQAIEAVFADRALDITVFNTSTPHDRFKTLESCLAPGTPWAREVVAYEEELKRYLRRNLAESAAYLLLVTPASLATQSKWIRFEIDVARSIARRGRTSFFFPCVADGVTLSRLPEGATEFQGLRLVDPGWAAQLASAVAGK
jgi:hypothetical protein